MPRSETSIKVLYFCNTAACPAGELLLDMDLFSAKFYDIAGSLSIASCCHELVNLILTENQLLYDPKKRHKLSD